MAIKRKTSDTEYRVSDQSNFAFLYITADETIPKRYITNVDASGAAARIQGYVARLGLGKTRTRNQINDINPKIGNRVFLNIFFNFCIRLTLILSTFSTLSFPDRPLRYINRKNAQKNMVLIFTFVML
jgi:hypothetical protein